MDNFWTPHLTTSMYPPWAATWRGVDWDLQWHRVTSPPNYIGEGGGVRRGWGVRRVVRNGEWGWRMHGDGYGGCEQRSRWIHKGRWGNKVRPHKYSAWEQYSGNFLGRKLSQIDEKYDFRRENSCGLLAFTVPRMLHPQISQRKLSQTATKPRNLRKLASFPGWNSSYTYYSHSGALNPGNKAIHLPTWFH